MSTRVSLLWVRVVALAPLLALLAALPSQVLMRCRMDGQIRVAACCCPASSRVNPGAGTSGVQAVLKAADCCDRLVVRAAHVPSEQVRPTLQLEAPVVATAFSHRLAIVLPPGDLAVSRVSEEGRGPPGAAFGLVLLKHAFLI